MPKLSIEDAKESLAELTASWMVNESLVGCYIYDTDGNLYIGSDHEACHGVLNRTTWNRNDVILSSFHNKKAYANKAVPSDEVQLRYVTWLMSDDFPLSKFVMDRDVGFVFNNGLIIDAQAAGWSASLYLCKVLRQTYENPQVVELWDRLVDNGMDEMFALYLSNVYGNYNPITRVYTSHGGTNAHGQVFTKAFVIGIENLFTRRVVPGSPGVCATLFLSSRPKNASSMSFVEEKMVAIPNGWGGEVESVGVTFEEILEFNLKIQEEIRKGL